MNKVQGLEQFFSTQTAEISVVGLVINLVLGALLSYGVYRSYVWLGSSLSNRRMFGRNFMMITMTTTLIITIVKSSLALSLGLVGALSIVRFRAAIKEPEELTYLFLCIAVGLGLGADQRIVTIVALALVLVVLWLMNISRSTDDNQNIHLVVASRGPGRPDLQSVVTTLETHCNEVNLRRFDETSDALEASFLVEFENFEKLNAGREAIRALGENVDITVLDNKALANVEQ
jgi:hypothetical protein